MADIKWIKLSVNMFDDEKVKLIRTMPEGDKITLVWIQLLCLAGRINDHGLVYMGQNLAYSDEMLATILGHPLNTMRVALTALEQFEMIDISDDGTIDIANWEKHQNIDGMERVRQLNAERNRKYRDRKKQKMLENSQDTDNDVSVTSRDGTDKTKTRLEEDKDKEVCSSSTSENSISDVFTFYQNNFGVMSPYHQDDLTHWSNDLSPDLAIEAMKRAIDGGKLFNYAKGILKNWMQKNYKTMADIESSEAQFERNKQQAPKTRFPYKRNQKEEVIPDWMQNQEQTTKQNKTDEHAESKEAEIRARLKALGLGGDDD